MFFGHASRTGLVTRFLLVSQTDMALPSESVGGRGGDTQI
jgi:hypothetical protein